jgi:hypothetical protein
MLRSTTEGLSVAPFIQSVFTMDTDRSLYRRFLWLLLVTSKLLCNGRHFVTATRPHLHHSPILEFCIQLLETCINISIFIGNLLVMAFPLQFRFYSLKLNKDHHNYIRRLTEPQQHSKHDTNSLSKPATKCEQCSLDLSFLRGPVKINDECENKR